MKNIILVLLFFLLLTVMMTFPLAFNINTHLSGTFDTNEPFAALWEGWRFKFISLHEHDLSSYCFISYPFGLPTANAIIFPVGMFIIRGLSVLTNEIFMYNFLVLLSFLLSGLFVFILVQYLTKNSLVSIFSGIIYAFCPYHFARAWQHLGLGDIQWMPLYLYALFRLRNERKLKNSIFVALVFFIFSENYIYAYFMIVATIVFAALIFFYRGQQQKRKIFQLLTLSACFIFLLTLPTAYIVYKNYFFGVPKEAISLYYRPFSDLFIQSARPLSYFLPTIFHPIFGNITQTFVGSDLYGKILTEHTLYLGWIPLMLSFVSYRQWRKKGKNYKPEIKNSNTLGNEYFYIGFFIILAIVAWFFSQPPWWTIGALKIYMPSFFMYKILPMFRAYCRFGIVVMLAVAVLAGFGLKFILDRCKTQKKKITITILFCILVLFEFWNYPPFRVIDLTKYPKVYDWLKAQPNNAVIAEYPLDLDGLNPLYLFYQTKHRKRMINATVPGTYANQVSRELTNLFDYKTAEGLSWLGVRYVLIHTEWYKNNESRLEQLETQGIEKNNGLKFIKHFDDVDVYEVVAPGLEPKVEKKVN